MIIADINYLEVTTEDVVGGRGVVQNSTVTINKTVVANVTEKISKTLKTNVGGLNGNVAQVIATADARGGNTTFTSIISGTQTEGDSSESFVQSVSATK
jgi:hypothetical protein